MKAIILAGGYAHPFAETGAALSNLADRAGLASILYGEVEPALAQLRSQDLLVVNALWWSMSQHPKYAPHRVAHARDLPPGAMNAMARHVALGGGLLAIHTATICWDREPRWKELLGGGWTWGRSHHPPLGEVTVAPTAAGAALSGSAAPFALVDECYHGLDPGIDCEILAHAGAGGDPPAQPVVWRRRVGAGRVAVDALGHDAASLAAPSHAALLLGLLRWCAA